MDAGTSQHQCLCGRSFARPGSLTSHQKNCTHVYQSLTSALVSAKEHGLTKKHGLLADDRPNFSDGIAVDDSGHRDLQEPVSRTCRKTLNNAKHGSAVSSQIQPLRQLPSRHFSPSVGETFNEDISMTEPNAVGFPVSSALVEQSRPTERTQVQLVENRSSEVGQQSMLSMDHTIPDHAGAHMSFCPCLFRN